MQGLAIAGIVTNNVHQSDLWVIIPILHERGETVQYSFGCGIKTESGDESAFVAAKSQNVKSLEA